MVVSLGEGGNVSLSKQDPGLRRAVVGLGWDVRATGGADYDLDASVFMLDEDGRVRGDEDFVFYNNPRSADGSVEHTGDNLTGKGEGDDEQVRVDLERVPPDVHKLAFSVTIHEADERRQNFGQVSGAFIRVVNGQTNNEVVRYNLTEYASTETAMIFGELYRRGSEWKFRAVGQGFAGGLGPLARNFGIGIADEAAEGSVPPLSTDASPAAPAASAESGPGVAVGVTRTSTSGDEITLHLYESPASPATARDQPEEGYEFSAFDIEGCAGQDPEGPLTWINPFLFRLVMPDNTRLQPEDPNVRAKKRSLDHIDLLPGDCVRGWVVFQTPKGEKPKGMIFSSRGVSGENWIPKWPL